MKRSVVLLVAFLACCSVYNVRGADDTKGPAANAVDRCDEEAFAEFVLPDFVSSCGTETDDDDFEACSEDCKYAMEAILTNDAAICLAQIVHDPMSFAGKGAFADADMQKVETDGLPDFKVSIVVNDTRVPLNRKILASMFLESVSNCNSEIVALSSGECGNSRFEVYMNTMIQSVVSACTAPNAVVLRPVRCSKQCAHAYYLARSHPCFARYFSSLDSAATNKTMYQLLDPTSSGYHAHMNAMASHPDPKAQERRTLIRNVARVCEPPSSLQLNVSACTGDAFEAYLALSVRAFHETCSDMVNNADPFQRYCTADCDASLQQVLWQPSCLGLWSSREAAKMGAGKGAPAELKTLSRAIQVCAVGRTVSYSIEQQIHTDDDGPVNIYRDSVSGHPAMRTMMLLLGLLVVIVFTFVAWQQRKRCRRGVRYQRVATEGV